MLHGNKREMRTLVILAVLVLEHPGTRGVVGALETKPRKVLSLLLVVLHARLVALLDALQLGKLLPLGQRLGLGHLDSETQTG